MEFRDVVQPEDELRELTDDAIIPAVVDKTPLALVRRCRAFNDRSPFVLISTNDAEGRMHLVMLCNSD